MLCIHWLSCLVIWNNLSVHFSKLKCASRQFISVTDFGRRVSHIKRLISTCVQNLFLNFILYSIILNYLLIKPVINNMNVSIRLANLVTVFKMKAECNILISDIKNLHVNHELTNIILYMFVNYATIIFNFIKITSNMMHKWPNFSNPRRVLLWILLSVSWLC
jgi:hypothetical protein